MNELETTKMQTPIEIALGVDENGMTTKPGVFAAGDVTTGSKTVVHAVEGAKIAAMGMIRYMEEN